MKRYLILIAGLFMSSCGVRQPLLTYDFPEEMALPVRTEYVKMWEKGKILYGINCAQCHNKVAARRVVVPDFTPDQLRGYELRVLNKEHESNMPDEKVTAEELVLISTFLLYKTKN